MPHRAFQAETRNRNLKAHQICSQFFNLFNVGVPEQGFSPMLGVPKIGLKLDENRNVATFPNEPLQLEKMLVNPDQKKHLRGCVRRPALKRSWAAHTDDRKPALPPGNPLVKGVRDCRSLKERPTIHERKITRNIRINIFVERSKSRKQ